MKKMIIVDIDGTICDSRKRMSAAIQDVLGRHIPPEQIKYSIEANVSASREEKRKIWHVFLSSRYIDFDTPIPYSVEMLNFFSEKKYKIIYLSSRPILLFNVTYSWLRRYGYPKGKLILRKVYEKDIIFKEREVHQLVIYNDVKYGLGDTPTDMKTYTKFGICPIGITTFYSKEKLIKAGGRIIVNTWKTILDNPTMLEIC